MLGSVSSILSPNPVYTSRSPLFNVASVDLVTPLTLNKSDLAKSINQHRFPHLQKKIGYEQFPDGSIGIHLDPALHLTLLKRQRIQHFTFRKIKILEALENIKTFNEGYATDPANIGLISLRHSETLKSLYLRFTSPTARMAELHSITYCNHEVNLPEVMLVH